MRILARPQFLHASRDHQDRHGGALGVGGGRRPFGQRDERGRGGLLPGHAFESRRGPQAVDFESRVCAKHGTAPVAVRGSGVHATFFVLGWVASRFPALVAPDCRGPARNRVARLRPSPGLRPHAGGVPRDPRLRTFGGAAVGPAPGYSITEPSAASAIEEGHHRYRHQHFPDSPRRSASASRGARHVHVMVRRNGSIVEAPASTVRCRGVNLPMAGGGYFRLLPYWWTRWGMNRLNRVEAAAGNLLFASCMRKSIRTSHESRRRPRLASAITETWEIFGRPAASGFSRTSRFFDGRQPRQHCLSEAAGSPGRIAGERPAFAMSPRAVEVAEQPLVLNVHWGRLRAGVGTVAGRPEASVLAAWAV